MRLCSTDSAPIQMLHGERFAQIIFKPYLNATLEPIAIADVPQSERGAAWNGSSGKF